METKFYTCYANRPVEPGEKLSQVCLVEKVGFVSMEERIQSLFTAGRNLDLYRASQYDYQFDDKIDLDSNDLDITRNKSFDFAEAYSHYQALKNRIALVRQKKTVDNSNNINNTVSSNESDASLKTESESPKEP